MRKYTKLSINNNLIQKLLADISKDNTTINKYRDAMIEIGHHIGKDIAQKKPENVKNLYLACTVEDADFLAKGIISELESLNIFQSISIACFWNKRLKIENMSTAPILRKYKEPLVLNEKYTLVILKSIISGSCVVRVNLRHLINEMNSENIIIAAPVMYEKAQANLNHEFDSTITNKFDYLTYAIDDEIIDGNVIPGIGGSIYERLGFGNQDQKIK
jgi:hypothetical protein